MVTHYAGTNAALHDSVVRLFLVKLLAIRVISLHKLKSRNHMVESAVANPKTLDREYRAFIAINMVHELDLQSKDSAELTLTRTKLRSKLTKIWGVLIDFHRKHVRRRSAPRQFQFIDGL